MFLTLPCLLWGSLCSSQAKKDQEADFPDGIPECGSDALRFGLLAYTVQGKDVNLDIKRVVSYRQFCNKLWNATRFAFMYMDAKDGAFRPAPLPAAVALVDAAAGGSPSLLLPYLPDAWILSRLAAAIAAVDAHLKAYEIAAAVTAVYEFWYKELCDVYLECIKPVMQLDGTSIANAATKHQTQSVLHAT